MVPVFRELAQGAGNVVGVQPDGTAKPLTEGRGFQPARHHHLVVRRAQRAAQMPVRHDAPAHWMQDRHIDAPLVEQMIADEFRVGARIAAIRTAGVGRIFAAGRPVPVHLIVRKAAALERLTQEIAEVGRGREKDVHARVDKRHTRSVRVLYHLNQPFAVPTTEADQLVIR